MINSSQILIDFPIETQSIDFTLATQNAYSHHRLIFTYKNRNKDLLKDFVSGTEVLSHCMHINAAGRQTTTLSTKATRFLLYGRFSALEYVFMRPLSQDELSIADMSIYLLYVSRITFSLFQKATDRRPLFARKPRNFPGSDR